MKIAAMDRRHFLKASATTLGSSMMGSLAMGRACSTPSSSKSLESQMELLWHRLWSHFYIPEVQTFADYISNYSAGASLNHLPSAEEVKRQFPNPCGYSTGMEDGLILGGAMLSGLVDKFHVTGSSSLRAQAKKIFEGTYLCGTAHGVPGFLARNVCREDRTSIYINSSRDQYTHAVHGIWKFAKSPLCDEESLEKAKHLLTQVGDRLIQTMVPETNYDFLRADGSPCGLGICKMWEVQSHEAARLPMIYAAAWDITKHQRFHDQWRRYIHEAIQQSHDPGKNKPAYALLQMQCSLELLHELEPEATLKTEIAFIMRHLASLGEDRFHQVRRDWATLPQDLQEAVGPDWRTVRIWRNQKGYPNPQWGDYRKSWHLTREVGEASLLPLMTANPTLSPEHRSCLHDTFIQMNYEKNSSCGLVYHFCSYWKAKRFAAI